MVEECLRSGIVGGFVDVAVLGILQVDRDLRDVATPPFPRPRRPLLDVRIVTNDSRKRHDYADNSGTLTIKWSEVR